MNLGEMRAATVKITAETSEIDTLAQKLRSIDAASEKTAAGAKTLSAELEKQNRITLSAANSLRTLEGRIDGVTRANRAAEAQEKTVRLAVEQRLVSDARAAELMQRIEANRQGAVASASARDSMRRTPSNENQTGSDRFGLRGYQRSNLAYQGGDVVAQLGSGSGIGTIALQQGPQIAQVLAEAEGGVKGVAAGLVSLATPTNLAIAGFTALAGGALAFAASRMHLKSMADVLAEQNDILGNITRKYQNMPSLISKGTMPNDIALNLRLSDNEKDFSKQVADQRLRLQTSVLDQFETSAGFGQAIQYQFRIQPEFRVVEAQLGSFFDTNGKLKTSFSALQDAMKKTWDDAADNSSMKEAAKAILGIVGPAVDAEAGLNRTSAAIREMTREYRTFRRSQDDFRTGLADLRAFAPEKMTDREKVEKVYGDLSLNARTEQQARQAETYRKAALDEIARKEDALRLGRNLDIQAITARTVAERAEIAAQRERINLSGVKLDANPVQDAAMKVEREEAERQKVRLEAARTARDALVSTQASFDQAGLSGYAASLAEINTRYGELIKGANGAADAVRDYQAAQRLEVQTLRARTERQLFDPLADRASSASAELAGIGKSESERRRLMTTMQAETALKRAGIDVNDDLGRSYLTAAERVSAMEEARDKARLAQEASFRRASLFMSDQEAQIAQTLRSNGIDADSVFGKELAAYERLTDRLNEFKEINREVWSGIGSDILKGASPLDRIGDNIQNVAGKLLDRSIQNGADALFNMTFGKQANPLAAPAIPKEMLGRTAANAMWVQLAGWSPLGGVSSASAVERHPLAPLNDPSSARVAGAFDLTSITDPAVLNTLRRNPDRAAVAKYYADGALARGLNPEITLRGLNQESGFNLNARNLTNREQSYGVAQLNTMGGLGAVALNRGIDVRDNATWRQQADFALDTMQKDGYRQWYGFRDVGIGRWDGRDRDAGSSGAAKAVTQLGESSTALAQNATQFSAGFASTLNDSLIGSMGSAVDQFAPGFGGVLQNLLNAVGQSSGGAGGLGGLIASAFGGGGSIFSTPESIMAAAKLPGMFADGGFTGHGGVHQPAGVVHRGEIVWSQRDIARAGGVGTVEAMRLGMRGYADGGYVGGSEPRIPANANPLPAANGNGPRVVINDMRTTRGAEPVETRETQDEFGRPQIEVMVRDIVRDETLTPGRRTARGLKGMGVSPPVLNR